jgi:CheY-like chemotaxis protein
MDNLRVLIVDDELQSRSLIRKLLSIYYPAFIVEEAETVISATEKVMQFNPNMVFLDVQTNRGLVTSVCFSAQS